VFEGIEATRGIVAGDFDGLVDRRDRAQDLVLASGAFRNQDSDSKVHIPAYRSEGWVVRLGRRLLLACGLLFRGGLHRMTIHHSGSYETQGQSW